MDEAIVHFANRVERRDSTEQTRVMSDTNDNWFAFLHTKHVYALFDFPFFSRYALIEINQIGIIF